MDIGSSCHYWLSTDTPQMHASIISHLVTAFTCAIASILASQNPYFKADHIMLHLEVLRCLAIEPMKHVSYDSWLLLQHRCPWWSICNRHPVCRQFLEYIQLEAPCVNLCRDRVPRPGQQLVPMRAFQLLARAFLHSTSPMGGQCMSEQSNF